MKRAIISAILLFASVTGAQAETVYKVWHHGSQDLLKTFHRIDGLDVKFTVTGPTQIFVSGHIDIVHRCLAIPHWGSNYPIAIGVRLEHLSPGDNFASSSPGSWVQGSKWGPNIANCVAHYGEVSLDGFLCVTTPGLHRISVWALAESDVNHYDGVAEINPASDSDQPGGTNDPYNEMIVRVVPTTNC